MNPQTLRPVEGMLQVTVMSPLAIDSDALSNALFASGPEDWPTMLTGQDCALLIREQRSEVEQQCASDYKSIRWPAEIVQPQLADLPISKEKEKI
jgi:thiamine biosynthesis lipoprotein ApbE